MNRSIILNVTPVAKPRMTQRDKWLKPARPAVAKYRAFAQELQYAVNQAGANVPDRFDIVFHMPIPKSRRKKLKPGDPHQQTPDRDNLLKSFQDALFKDDAHIYDGRVGKYWAETGYIELIVPN